MNATLSVLVIFPMLCFGAGEQEEQLSALQKQVDSLQRGQKSIKEAIDALQDILLGRRPPSGENNRIDVSHSPAMGSPRASLALVEFSDFQCPFCAEYERETFNRLAKQYIDNGMVRYIAVNYPLKEAHPLAEKAAVASLCAEEQGRFWEFREKLFLNQKELDLDGLIQSATVLGLDVKRFSECLESGKYTEQIMRDIRQAQDLGVRGTPTFFIGYIDPSNSMLVQPRKMLGGALPYREFQSVIDGLLERQEPRATEKNLQGGNQ